VQEVRVEKNMTVSRNFGIQKYQSNKSANIRNIILEYLATNLEDDNDAEQSCCWSSLIYGSDIENLYYNDDEESVNFDDDKESANINDNEESTSIDDDEESASIDDDEKNIKEIIIIKLYAIIKIRIITK